MAPERPVRNRPWPNMNDKKRPPFSGDSLKARALRGTGMLFISIFGSNLLRLASNLILTRILFPEAFGLMALVQVFMGGLEMFSDMGLKTSVMQSKRGDDPHFLNTVWTVQILRGIGIWVLACILAPVAAWIYDEPMLLALLPVVGFRQVIGGFTTTNIATANRHLRLGRQLWAELGCQAFGIVLTIILAIILQSVWAMVWAGLVAAVFRGVLFHLIMPGIRNRLRWQPEALGDLFQFGKWIFLATVVGFIIRQGDRAVLGAFISLAELGVYNIGLFMGTIPFIFSKAVANRVITPLYRMRPPAESQANRRKLFKARRLVVAVTLAFSTTLAFIGVPMIDFLYDPRYALAGPMVVFFSLCMVPQVVFDGYTGALLGRGDSKNFFYLLAATAAVQVAILFWTISDFGILAAIAAPGIAAMVVYPLRIHMVRKHRSWDMVGDFSYLALGFALNGFAVWLAWDEIVKLIPAAV